jgi:hypothetical protein
MVNLKKDKISTSHNQTKIVPQIHNMYRNSIQISRFYFIRPHRIRAPEITQTVEWRSKLEIKGNTDSQNQK